MTLTAILTLLRDATIIGALGYILWYIHRADTNAIKVADLQAVQKQLAANSAEEAKWQQERENAEAQSRVDIANVNAHIDANHAPVIVRFPSGAGTVPTAPSCPSGGAAGPGGGSAATGEGFDARAQINDYERWVESNFATCRRLLSSWPH